MQPNLILIFLQPVLCQYVSTYAGSLYGYADGQRTNAKFQLPCGIYIDGSGNQYVSEYDGDRIRKIDTKGYVTTLAGNGVSSYSDGWNTSASFHSPNGLTVDNFGNIFVADEYNNRIRKINASGYVSTVAGNGNYAYADGQDINAEFYYPTDVVFDASGNLFVLDSGNSMIRKINTTGYVSTVAGSGSNTFADGQGQSASFYWPIHMAIDITGNLYIADQNNNRIRKVNVTGYVTTIAGSGLADLSDGQGLSATFYFPIGITIDQSGNIYIADCQNNAIRKLNATGFVSTVAGNGQLSHIDGPGLNATFNCPYSLAFDLLGDIFVTDYGNNVIRKITLNNGNSTSIPVTLPSTLTTPSNFFAVTALTSTVATTIFTSPKYTSTSIPVTSRSTLTTSTVATTTSTGLNTIVASCKRSSVTTDKPKVTTISPSNEAQYQSIPFYFKQEFIYGSFLGFFAFTIFLIVFFNTRRQVRAQPRRRILTSPMPIVSSQNIYTRSFK